MQPLCAPANRSARLGVLLPLIVLLSSCGAVEPQPVAADQIDTWMSSLYECRLFNGALIVSDAGELVYSKGLGSADFEKDIPFTTRTTADTGSYTKAIVATAIFALQEEGRLDIEDSVERYLPAFPYEGIRIVDLLSHSSGMPDHDVFEGIPDLQIEWTNEYFLNLLERYRPELRFPTGSRIEYNGLGYDLLGLVIEQVSGQLFEGHLRDRFFDPLGMADVFLRPRYLADWKTHRTIGYEYVGDSIELNDSDDDEAIYGSANLFFSAADLHQWNQAFLEDPPLSPETLTRALSPYRLESGIESTLNLLSHYASADSNRFWFTGHWKGFYTMVYRDLEQRRSIVHVTNTSMPMWLRANLELEIVQLLDGGRVKPSVPDLTALTDDELESVAGTYRMSGLGDCEVSYSSEGLFVEFSEGLKVRAFRADPAVFFVPARGAWLWFSKADDGAALSMSWTTPVQRSSGERLPAHSV